MKAYAFLVCFQGSIVCVPDVWKSGIQETQVTAPMKGSKLCRPPEGREASLANQRLSLESGAGQGRSVFYPGPFSHS